LVSFKRLIDWTARGDICWFEIVISRHLRFRVVVPVVSGYQRDCWSTVGDDMTLTNIALWIIFLGIIAIVPIGCIMSRRPPSTDKSNGL
jgi:hypothetical protein